MLVSASVSVSVDKYTILMKDHELVGEDPVLTRELRRRMPAVSESELNIGGDGGGAGGVGDLDEANKEMSEMTQARRGGGHGTLNETETRSGNRMYSENKTSVLRHRRQNTAYNNQPGDNVVEEFALQMIEQAIYSVQYRLNEADPYIQKYAKDVRFRMGYIFKQLERWIYEMDMMYSYITHVVRRDTKPYNVLKNLVYYSHLLRKNLDITYTIYHLLEIHTVFYASVRKAKKEGAGTADKGAHEKPHPKDLDMNDPEVVQAMMDLDSHENEEA